MNSRIKTIFALAALVLWCGFIFYMSSRVAEESDALSLGFIGHILSWVMPDYDSMSLSDQLALEQNYNHLVRKLAHFTEFALLGALALNAARHLQLRHPLALSWAFSVLYAASDEIHQLFVPGRAGMITDVCIDSCGALLGVLLLALLLHAKSCQITPSFGR